jgi:hypothetical protein
MQTRPTLPTYRVDAALRALRAARCTAAAVAANAADADASTLTPDTIAGAIDGVVMLIDRAAAAIERPPAACRQEIDE